MFWRQSLGLKDKQNFVIFFNKEKNFSRQERYVGYPGASTISFYKLNILLYTEWIVMLKEKEKSEHKI